MLRIRIPCPLDEEDILRRAPRFDSQAFFWHEEWRTLGYTSLKDFPVGFWEGFFLDNGDANDLLLG